MLEYDFMRTAFAASGMAAVLAGTVGFFLVLRGQTFAGHALSHAGFTGATGPCCSASRRSRASSASHSLLASAWDYSAKSSLTATWRSA
jgi:ABC-type Mn2+/Zn2+ transport system permease subunit